MRRLLVALKLGVAAPPQPIASNPTRPSGSFQLTSRMRMLVSVGALPLDVGRRGPMPGHLSNKLSRALLVSNVECLRDLYGRFRTPATEADFTKRSLRSWVLLLSLSTASCIRWRALYEDKLDSTTPRARKLGRMPSATTIDNL